MTRPLFEDLLARSLAQLPEMETRILADEVARLRARVAELEAKQAPDVVPVPREEWAVWQKVKSAVCRLDKGISADEWDTVLIGVVRSIHALRSGEAGKNATTNGAENG